HGGRHIGVVEAHDRLHAGGAATGAHHIGAGPAPQDSADRIDQNRLPGPGLTGEYGEARLQANTQLIDDREVGDRKLKEHTVILQGAGEDLCRWGGKDPSAPRSSYTEYTKPGGEQDECTTDLGG